MVNLTYEPLGNGKYRVTLDSDPTQMTSGRIYDDDFAPYTVGKFAKNLTGLSMGELQREGVTLRGLDGEVVGEYP